MKKIILPGIIVGGVNLVLGMVVNNLFMLRPEVMADYKNANVMRPWSDPIMSLFFLYPFVLGVILAWAWDKSKGLFKGQWPKPGINFGLAIWIITTIPGMLVSYSSFPLALATIISWTISGLVTIVAAGVILAKLNK